MPGVEGIASPLAQSRWTGRRVIHFTDEDTEDRGNYHLAQIT